jgi:hypothetical protein
MLSAVNARVVLVLMVYGSCCCTRLLPIALRLGIGQSVGLIMFEQVKLDSCVAFH